MKVGNIVTCKKEYEKYYRYTKNGVIGKVQEIFGDGCFEGLFYFSPIDEERVYDVDTERFERVFAKVG